METLKGRPGESPESTPPHYVFVQGLWDPMDHSSLDCLFSGAANLLQASSYHYSSIPLLLRGTDFAPETSDVQLSPGEECHPTEPKAIVQKESG